MNETGKQFVLRHNKSRQEAALWWVSDGYGEKSVVISGLNEALHH